MSRSATPISLFARSFGPSVRTLRTYSVDKFRGDVLAGLTVSVVELPQAMAYALIAGVPPQYGIYTSIIQGVLGALLSSSEHLATGPTNTQSLLIAAAVQRLVGDPGNPIYLELVFALTLLKGVIQLTLAVARMGHLIRYVGTSVILGVASGAGVLIIVGQLPNLLGVTLPPNNGESALPGVLATLHRLTLHTGEVNPWSIGIGLAGVAIIVGCRAISRFIPGAMIAVVVSAGFVWAMGWSPAELAQVGALPRGLPALHLPTVSLDQYESLLPGALALALLGLIESVAIVKSVAMRTGERINANREFFAQGFGNTVSSAFLCIPGSGSFTRTALVYDAGGRTRFAAVFNAVFAMVIYLALAPAAAHIPLASLAAVLLVIAVGLIDWRYFRRVLRMGRGDAAVFIITFLATIFVPLQYAVFIGIFLSLALFLRQASRLHMEEVVSSETGQYIERPLRERAGSPPVRFCQIEGDLFFGLADELEDKLSRLAHSDADAVVLRLKRTHSMDATVLNVFEQFTRNLKQQGKHLILCGIRPELMDVLRRYGLVDLIGPENVFETDVGVFTSAKRAIERAQRLVGERPAEGEPATAGWHYQI